MNRTIVVCRCNGYVFEIPSDTQPAYKCPESLIFNRDDSAAGLAGEICSIDTNKRTGRND